MIGGHTKTVEPEAVYLRDGDVVIMSGQARMAYHAVPKVLPHDFPIDTQIQQSKLDVRSHCLDPNPNRETSTDPETQATLNAEVSVIVAVDITSCKRRNDDHTLTRDNKRSKSESDGMHCTDTYNKVTDNEFWRPFSDYLRDSRININIRQMFEPGKGPTDYTWPLQDPAKT